jgi:hypothetical protein
MLTSAQSGDTDAFAALLSSRFDGSASPAPGVVDGPAARAGAAGVPPAHGPAGAASNHELHRAEQELWARSLWLAEPHPPPPEPIQLNAGIGPGGRPSPASQPANPTDLAHAAQAQRTFSWAQSSSSSVNMALMAHEVHAAQLQAFATTSAPPAFTALSMDTPISVATAFAGYFVGGDAQGGWYSGPPWAAQLPDNARCISVPQVRARELATKGQRTGSRPGTRVGPLEANRYPAMSGARVLLRPSSPCRHPVTRA